MTFRDGMKRVLTLSLAKANPGTRQPESWVGRRDRTIRLYAHCSRRPGRNEFLEIELRSRVELILPTSLAPYEQNMLS